MLDIIINIKEDGLTEELLDKAKERFIELANCFIKDKDIKANIQIIIPNDFSKELTDISKQILKMYECFGIYIKLTEDNQLYIDIPL